MQLSLSTLVALGLAIVQTTYGAPAPVTALSKRTIDNLPPSDQFVACPGYRYSRAQVEQAIQRGVTTTPTSQPQPAGYPHVFGNNRKLPFAPECAGKKLYEFPLLNGDSIFGGGDPGPDRVVFYIYTDNPDTNPTDDGAYCGVMTHTNAPPNEFALCLVED